MLDKCLPPDQTEREGGRGDAERRALRNSSGQASLAGQLLDIRVKQNALATAIFHVLRSLGDDEGMAELRKLFPRAGAS